jgi:putative transposase
MPHNYDLLFPDKFYHLYNRAIGSELMFKNDDNYRFFLQKINKYISPIASFYAYSLIPNHFHFLIRIKELEIIEKQYAELKGKKLPKDAVLISDFLMEQFSNCFNAYTKSFNKVHNRKGKLFMDHMHRKEIAGDVYFTKVIHYIHANAIHH